MALLTEAFLAPYRAKGDSFPNLLARSTYLGKYCRNDEGWSNTVRRVVEGNCALDPNVGVDEAEDLYHAIWHGWALPPGRGLWTGGVQNIPVESLYNCHYGTLRSIEDWVWAADMLMCGGGVGIGLHAIGELPEVRPYCDFGAARREERANLHILCNSSHPNQGEVLPDDPRGLIHQYVIEDTRQGWVRALRLTLQHAFAGADLALNLSSIRPRGAPIRTFGGIACGPGPLAALCREVWAIVRKAAGRKLTSVECLDITNHIGVCIKSGNVRRSALIVLGQANDDAFRSAKQDWDAVRTHRHSSNNSIVFTSQAQIDAFDWTALVNDLATYGEPGIVNLVRMREDDPGAEGTNPCGEIVLHDREACCLSEVFPALIPEEDLDETLRLITRYTLRQRLQPMVDAKADKARTDNMRIGVGLGGVCDFEWTNEDLEHYRDTIDNAAMAYASKLGVRWPIATTTVKPSGTISLLNGSSPGMHAPYAPYYLRRTRIGKQEPMAKALQAAGVPHEDCIYDATGNTLVFAFPMAARVGTAVFAAVFAVNEPVRSQIERQVALQEYYADNSVSVTITFAEHERAELAALLKLHINSLKSVSCLPRAHGYAQPPYEEIDGETWARLSADINHDHPLTSGGDLDVGECATGACPIR